MSVRTMASAQKQSWKAVHRWVRRAFGNPPAFVRRRVVVTGLGLVTPLGVGVSHVWEKILRGECGIRKLQAEEFPGEEACFEKLPSKVAGCVPRGVEVGAFDDTRWYDSRSQASFIGYALAAAHEALVDAGWNGDEIDRDRCGVAVGAGMGCTAEVAQAGVLMHQAQLRRLSPFFVPKMLINMAAGGISIKHGLRGPQHAAATACASGAHSIGDAFRLIATDQADMMVAGGTEGCIDLTSIGGFSRLKALATTYNDNPAKASRPWDRDRDGFVIAEGAGILILEDMEHAMRRNAKIYAEIRGCGLSSDGVHITQPPPDGSGAALAMKESLRQAGLLPSDIGYINAHATSTPLGDVAEARAISTVFGAAAAQGKLPVSSTKGAIGHLLGAAGAVESVFTVLALHNQSLPPTINLQGTDQPDLHGFDFVPYSKNQVRPGKLQAAMCNSFGFGGVNCSLTFASLC